MSFSIEGTQPNVPSNTSPVGSSSSEALALRSGGATSDALVATGTASNHSTAGAATVGQIPNADSYLTSSTDREISDHIGGLETSQQAAQQEAASSSGSSTSTSTSSNDSNLKGALKAASDLDDAWAEFENADTEAKDFVKIQMRVQKALQFFQMALQIMNAVFEAKKAASQGIRY